MNSRPQIARLSVCLPPGIPRRVWCAVFASIAIFFNFFVAQNLSHAEGPQHHAALFSRAAMNRANHVHTRNSQRVLSRSWESEGLDFLQPDISTTADTVQEIFQGQRSGADFFSQYRSPLYLNYLSDVVHVPELEEWRERAAAERIFVYQSVTSVSQVLMKSALEPFFRKTIKNIQALKRFTSVKVQRGASGGFGVSQKVGKEKPLFELKLHVSANNGIEPRLEVGEHFLLRHDIVHDDTIAEFRTSF